ncbi:MAG: hypothetical protein LBL66_06080 [Clostridiales bacterium]|jgi:hypothetical protein|nr:hypothetical protein [Clostridiales bacterium]
MKHATRLLTMLLAFTMLFLAACSDTPAPEITITVTSAKTASITTEETYTLEYTTENADSSSVAVTGGAGGSYNESTKVFSATAAGTYTLTVTAVKGDKTKADSVTVTVTAADAEPAINVTSDAAPTVGVNKNYTLAYTVEPAGATSSVVAAKTDGGETFTYTEGTRVFRASAVGTYTLTVTAQNGSKSKTAVVTITVVDSAPEIQFAAGKQDTYTVAVNADLTLPSATAEDELDGDLTDKLEVTPVTPGGVTFTKNPDGTYKFRAAVAGEHHVSYFVDNSLGNEAEEFITVNVTPATPETAVTTEQNTMANLNVSGEQFVENFARGYDSPLANMTLNGKPAISFVGGADAIDGNSMLLDFTGVTNTDTAAVYLPVGRYIKSGRWQIEMDYKVLGGNAAQFYPFSFIYEGDVSGDNGENKGMVTDGEVQHITFDEIKTFDGAKSWMFRIMWFVPNGATNPFTYNNLKVAIDNIKFTWNETVDPVVERAGTPKVLTDADFAGGSYTLDGTDGNYTAISGDGGPQYVQIDKLAAAERLTSEDILKLTPENGFHSDYAVMMTTQRNAFDALKGVLSDVNWVYTVTMKVFWATGASGDWYFLSDQGSGITSASASGGNAGTMTCSDQRGGAFSGFTIYSGNAVGVMLVGDITVSRTAYVPPAEPITETPNGHAVGKTWTFTADQLENFGADPNSNFITGTAIEKSAAPAGVKDCAEEGFDGAKVRCFELTNDCRVPLFYFIPEGGTPLIEKTKAKYKITIWSYTTDTQGSVMVWDGGSIFRPINASDGVGYHKSVVEIGYDANNFIHLLTSNTAGDHCTIYVAKVTVEITEINQA